MQLQQQQQQQQEEEAKRRVDGASFQCQRSTADGGTGGSSPPAPASSASFASTSTVTPADPRRHDASPRLPRFPSLRQHRGIPSLLTTTVNVDPSLSTPGSCGREEGECVEVFSIDGKPETLHPSVSSS
ncbi:hypothetical protein MUK42_17818 [Musa troglodytarum]|uniref:Uncharacterized protein n=1 Tax=Musa troglodytarum TaxID=320322 RepID=A0A9E7HGT1_9LILI|nr:hypothetical protein MUK42_17818 [Musa troglodytarum]